MKTILFIILTLYSLHQLCYGQGNSSYSNNPCETHQRCGAFAICNALNSPICSCLEGFNPVNQQQWSSGNWTSGCTRRVLLGCQRNIGTNNGTEDGFMDLEMIKIPSGYPSFGQGSECRNRCLMNCTCMAYSSEVRQSCSLWIGDLFDIQRSPSYSEGSRLYVRMASSEIVVKHQKTVYKKIMPLAVVIVFGIIASISGYLYWKWWTKQRGERSTYKGECSSDLVDASVQAALDRVNLLEFPLYKIKVLVNATNNFSEENKLGKGGFGPVYKGRLPNGREIAVKRLSKVSGQGLQEFMNEVELISRLQHKNLVRLLGCCVEGKEKMLIYEYMPNKSLDFFLFGNDLSEETLDWNKRFNIIEGICRGLLYLHRDSRLKIIHRDLKPGNILLDGNWNPKISDFGMARIYGTKQDHASTVKVVGTYGYMAPEYAIEGKFSEKSDVFSFGVLMLEIATGKRNRTVFRGEASLVNLLGYAWKLWSENNIAIMMDPRISNPSNQIEILRCVKIGLLCVQELPMDRPSISYVLSMLSNENVEVPEPKQPATSVKSSHWDTNTSCIKQSEESNYSMNSLTITMLDGR